MADNLRKFTTQEVLNKVYTDSSGDTIGLQAQTSKETLNAVLNTSTNSLNVSLSGSNTISGDVTITGDLTVQGGGSLAFDEIIEGTQVIDVDSTEALLVRKNGDSGDVFIVDTTNSRVGVNVTSPLVALHVSGDIQLDDSAPFLLFKETGSNKDMQFKLQTDGRMSLLNDNAATEVLTVLQDNSVGIGTASPTELLEVEKDQNAHTVIQADNNTAGTGASGGFKASADGADLYMRAFSSSFTTSGRNIQDAVQLLSVGASGGFVIASNHATADMSFWTNDTQRLTIDGDTGNVGIGIDPISTLDINISTDARGSFTSSIGEIGSGVFALQVTNAAGSALKPMGIRAEDIRLVTGSVSALTLNSSGSATFAKGVTISNGNLDIAATKKLFFDAGGDTYIHEQAADKLDFFVGNGTRFVLDVNSRISLSNNDSGTGGQDSTSSNTIIGYKAGNAVTSTTINNTFIGHNAGLLANDAVANVVIGTNSADALTTGDHNVALGYFALSASTDVDSAIAIGSGAMESGNVTGDGSIAIGRNSLSALTSGAGNTAVGMSSLSTGTGFSTNTALGFESGKYLGGNGSANASSLNTCIGAYSMGGGNQSSPSSNTANQNTAIGHGVLGGGTGSSTNITATKNVGVGYAVMNTVTTAQSNSILGYTAGIAITSGNENVAVGSRSLGTADIATFNVAVGGDAMFGIPTGRAVSGVVAIGLEACKGGGSTTTGIDGSVAVGRASLKNITTGTGNTAIGFTSGEDVTTGASNTFVGYQAGNTGTVDIVGGNSNTFVGAETRGSNASAINQTVIGKGAQGQGNNIVVLGNTDVTDVYMAQDKGATVHAAGVVVSEGINFPDDASANPSSDANTLDNYEEGTHTATVTCGTSGTITLNGSIQTLTYVKVGRQVTVNGLLFVSSVSSPDGFFKISLPFAIASGDQHRVSGGVGMDQTVSANVSDFVGVGIPGESVLRVYLGDNILAQSTSAYDIKATTYITLGLTYFV
jgi:hypothetical protein